MRRLPLRASHNSVARLVTASCCDRLNETGHPFPVLLALFPVKLAFDGFRPVCQDSWHPSGVPICAGGHRISKQVADRSGHVESYGNAISTDTNPARAVSRKLAFPQVAYDNFV